MDKDIIRSILLLGFRVFMRGPGYNLLTYSSADGSQIAELELRLGGGLHVATRHQPNRQSGSGFGVGRIDKITKGALEAGFLTAPHWASEADRLSVRKYQNVTQYYKTYWDYKESRPMAPPEITLADLDKV